MVENRNRIAEAINTLDNIKEHAHSTQHILTLLEENRSQLERTITNLMADNKMLMDLVLKHGGHTEDCEYIEECASGRILENEEDLCTCGWSETALMIRSRMSW